MEEKTIWRIDCPFCQRRLFDQGAFEATQNERTGQQFIKVRYTCPYCDYWLTVEIPRKLALAQPPPVPGFTFPEPVAS